MSTYQRQMEWQSAVARRNQSLASSAEKTAELESSKLFKPRMHTGARMNVVEEGSRSRDQKSLHVKRQEEGRREKERRRVGQQGRQAAVRQVRTAPLPVEGTPGEGGGNTGGYREAFEQDLRSDSPGRYEGGGEDGFFYDQLVREREEWGLERARLLNVIEVRACKE